MTDAGNDASAGPADADADAEGEAETETETGTETEADAATEADASIDSFYDAMEAEGRPALTARQVARRLGVSEDRARETLNALVDGEALERAPVAADDAIWYPTEWGEVASRERTVVFPERREIVVDQPTQYARAQLSQFARLVDTSGTPASGDGTRNEGAGGYLYRIRPEDVWQAPFDDLDALLGAVRSALPRRSTHLEEWIEDQWHRAHQFTLFTHEDGYTVLEAASESLMGNVARQKLDSDQLHAPISDTESWVRDDAVASIKRTLYDAGYPVVDERELETGDPIDADLTASLREYQRDWVDRFVDRRSGVFVGPPGSGKTVAAVGALTRIGGETLVLAPSRELASQWREELLDHSTLSPDQIGEYHGGRKQIRPVTIATYQTAGMDRHRSLFEEREWGLIVFDEAHHVPAPVFRRTADLQAKHRLGLSATPVRETDDEKEIFTLIGPPIGADWEKLFEAGFVAEPEVEIRYVPWRDQMAANEYGSAEGRDRHRLAAANPAKVEETRRLLAAHDDEKALIFVEYLAQGRQLADALDLPFLSGETRHRRRRTLLSEFRSGEREALIVSRVGDEGIDLPDAGLAVVASGLGGSRRQGAQRAGRTMRPTGSALVYVLATRGTTEEEFAQRQMRHLAEKGVRVRERTVDEGALGAPDAEDGDGDGNDDGDGSDGAASNPTDAPAGSGSPVEGGGE